MEKITKSNIYGVFIHLANAFNKPVYISKKDMATFKKGNEYFPEPKLKAEKYLQVGSWSLSYASCYGGWQINDEMLEDEECIRFEVINCEEY